MRINGEVELRQARKMAHERMLVEFGKRQNFAFLERELRSRHIERRQVIVEKAGL